MAHAAQLLLEKLAGQCDGIIAANPFLEPTKKFPKKFSDEDKKTPDRRNDKRD